ncbi:MAG: hypothetical protein LBC92_04145 [Rickettsiales bacterium]|jgi:hypothetical protein|nr:hypothetical protein [Rickettsiales bacterium]
MKFNIFFVSFLFFACVVNAAEKTKEEILKDNLSERIGAFYVMDAPKATQISEIFIGNLSENEIKSLSDCFSKSKKTDDKAEYYRCVTPHKNQLDMIIRYNK